MRLSHMKVHGNGSGTKASSDPRSSGQHVQSAAADRQSNHAKAVYIDLRSRPCPRPDMGAQVPCAAVSRADTIQIDVRDVRSKICISTAEAQFSTPTVAGVIFDGSRSASTRRRSGGTPARQAHRKRPPAVPDDTVNLIHCLDEHLFLVSMVSVERDCTRPWSADASWHIEVFRYRLELQKQARAGCCRCHASLDTGADNGRTHVPGSTNETKAPSSVQRSLADIRSVDIRLARRLGIRSPCTHFSGPRTLTEHAPNYGILSRAMYEHRVFIECLYRAAQKQRLFSGARGRSYVDNAPLSSSSKVEGLRDVYLECIGHRSPLTPAGTHRSPPDMRRRPPCPRATGQVDSSPRLLGTQSAASAGCSCGLCPDDFDHRSSINVRVRVRRSSPAPGLLPT
ncbi:hypothetical protein OH77DRAFT_979911 [Trametes cingulata]|nr:hypothetical protein OH77DRAFT_979911 [Trametes cingulata]